MNNHIRFFIISHLLLGLSLICWFMPLLNPVCQEIDTLIFKTLNQSLNQNAIWQSFWGLLNHRIETTYNLLIAALLNLWAVLQTKNVKLKQKRILQLIYFWILFQIGFSLQEYTFHTFLHLERHSPSLTIKGAIKLSTVLQDPNIKDFSMHCFPSGHAFALIYWASFSLICAPKRIGFLGLFLAFFLCLPRLFSGAHWASDTLFSGLLALCWLSWTLIFPLYDWMIKKAKANTSK